MGNAALRRAMDERGMTTQALAEHVGVDLKTAGRWLGGTTPHPPHRRAAADALDHIRVGVRDHVGLTDRGAPLSDADHRRQPRKRHTHERALDGVGVVELEYRRARGDGTEHGHEAERVAQLAEERGRIASHGVRQHEGAAALGDGRADLLRELGAELAPLALALEREGRRDQTLAAYGEHRDRQRR